MPRDFDSEDMENTTSKGTKLCAAQQMHMYRWSLYKYLPILCICGCELFAYQINVQLLPT